MEDNMLLSEVLLELKTIKASLQDTTIRLVKTEIAIDTINKGIEVIEHYRERVQKLEGSYQQLTNILDKTNNALDKLDTTVDSIKEILTIQKGQQKTANIVWEVVKWVGVGSIFPAVKALLDHYAK